MMEEQSRHGHLVSLVALGRAHGSLGLAWKSPTPWGATEAYICLPVCLQPADCCVQTQSEDPHVGVKTPRALGLARVQVGCSCGARSGAAPMLRDSHITGRPECTPTLWGTRASSAASSPARPCAAPLPAQPAAEQT